MLDLKPENSKENIAKLWTLLVAIFYWTYLPRQGKQKKKKKQMGLHQTKKFLHSKGKHQQNKKTAHRMGEHVH